MHARAALSIVAVTLAQSASALEPLSASQLEALFEGKRSLGVHTIQKYRFQRYYASNGELFSRTLSKQREISSAVSKGRWWVADDQLCIQWDGFDLPLCRLVAPKGDGYVKYLITRRGKPKVVVRYSSFKYADGLDP